MSRKYTKEILESAVNKSITWKEVCEKLGIKKIMSGSQTHIKNIAIKFGIDYSHFPGQAHGKSRSGKPLENYLKKGSNIKSNTLKAKLVKEKLKDDVCEICGLKDWLGSPISLELDHIDSDHSNNELSNLQILCPNCHAQKTKKDITARKKPKTKRIEKKYPCTSCDGLMSRGASNCKKCTKIKLKVTKDKNNKLTLYRKTKINWPSPEQVLIMVRNTSFYRVGKLLGVSDNAVRKFLKKHAAIAQR